MTEQHRQRRSYIVRGFDELGLTSLYCSSADVKLLCLQRYVRLFAYGASTLVLVLYLQALGITKTRIGLFMTLTLAGDVCISFVLTLFADSVGRKAILAIGAALMAGSGAVFAFFENYWVLLAAAVFGVISPSGNEIGPFRAIEESVVAHLTTSSTRSDIYAWYSLLGTAGTACGMITCGWIVHYLSVDLRWELANAYRAVFLGYAILGLVKFILSLMLSGAVEAEKSKKPASTDANSCTEASPLLCDRNETANEQPKTRSRLAALLPNISKESLSVVISLCLLFAVDSFASGLAPLSWVTYFFRSRYHIEEGKLGSIFFVTSLISAASMIAASSFAKRFGNVNTMVFTHLPSAIFLALIPIPNDVYASVSFLILRACTQSMDVAPRSAFLAAIMLPQERTVIMGLVNVVKTAAQSLGPLITGLLAGHDLFWVSFVSAGSLKVGYDLGLLVIFKNHVREKAERERISAERRVGDEDGA
ncbi:MFS general substrate transporter [Periconia macrospinosa]|uniref:MFS general substrate transporter n=1 Tax=Periconia macrospinosa TaxID=97972 RepID=A0A2V1D423_9PLEO|nr:MFS general substrate transporter [Periconia macrospinosa]